MNNVLKYKGIRYKNSGKVLLNNFKKIMKVLFATTILFTGVQNINMGAATCNSVSECKNQKDAILAEKDEKQNQIDGLDESIDGLESKIALLDDQVSDIQDEISINENSIVHIEEDITQKELEVEKTEVLVLDRLSYKQQIQADNSILSLLMSSSSLTDFMKRYNVLKKFDDEDKNLIDTFNALVVALDEQKKELEKQQQELTELATALESKRTEVIDAKRALNAEKVALYGDMDSLTTSQADIDKQLRHLKDQLLMELKMDGQFQLHPHSQ